MTSYALACLLILITPGPTNTLLAAAGAAMGWRRAMALTVAEALGYVGAIGAFVVAAGALGAVPFAMPLLKGLAAVWLLVTAFALWSQPVVPGVGDGVVGFRRVLLTTMLNPKAMLVGTILIPDLMPNASVAAVLAFAPLSLLAGAGWVVLGSMLPEGLRRYSYRGAAMIVSGFALAAMVSAWQG